MMIELLMTPVRLLASSLALTVSLALSGASLAASPGESPWVKETYSKVRLVSGSVPGMSGDHMIAGVQIRLEVHGRGTSGLPNIQRIMETCDHENAVVCWNCNETDLAGRGLEHNFRIVMKWIGIYHIHDLTTDYPWQELFSYAKKSGFTGWMLLEEGEPTSDPIRVMKYYRKLWEYMTK